MPTQALAQNANVGKRSSQQHASDSACALANSEARSVTKVLDGETMVVDGGGEVRLIGAMAPRGSDAAAAGDAWAPADLAKAGLEALVAGKNIQLAFAGRRTDRYGRLLAHVFVDRAGASVYVQGEMLRLGLARAYVLDGNMQCLAELLGYERIAREAAAGLWAEPAYSVLGASDLAALHRVTGTFQIVEGRVAEVSDRGGTAFVNFDEDWRQDFTISIRTQARKQMAATGLDPSDLKGRKVRVRGWIVRRGGPMIEIAHPGEIEVLTEATMEREPKAARKSRTRAAPRPPASGN